MSEFIRLVKNGIFPLMKDENGNPMVIAPETGFSFAGTIQGEGKLIGVPVLFIRTSGCNLRCIWRLANGNISICDTKESSFDTRNSVQYDINKVLNLIKYNIGNLNHIVISGGEPMLQSKSLVKLCMQIKSEFNCHITIETNGTIFIPELINYVDLFSISPKLINSTPDIDKLESAELTSFAGYIEQHEKRRINLKALQDFLNYRKDVGAGNYDVQFKFVVSDEGEENEIKDLILDLINLKKEDIILMPLGVDDLEINLSSKIVVGMAIRNGWRYSSRLHIDLFSNLVGV